MKINIKHVAQLANLKLTAEEEKTFEKQLGEVLEYVSQLDKVNTEKIEPIGHITGLENVGREDVAAPSLTQEDAIGQAAKIHNGFVAVDAIFDENDE
ncbi:MAG TPA: Asp-tRNA(Asn)/Glu-tRNA(Gln) amidotransferase subunit GatC [Candidatus Saccharimonadales bacterium]|nr:Asp-tRNA(Asn)/Glu-tRNA(Gln) amidotransferase subunit GatC [Candidatus Saccharimonadales bacterium]